MFVHLADLVEPDFGEFLLGRTMFEDTFEHTTPEEQGKAYWDYDSETGKRYSDTESEEDTNSGSEQSIKTEASASEKNSPSYSSSEDSAGSHQKRRRLKKKKVIKNSVLTVPLEQYTKEKEELSNHLDERLERMESKVEDVSSKNNTLEKINITKEKENKEVTKKMNDLKNDLKNERLKSAEFEEGLKYLKIELNNLKLAKEAFEKNKNSTTKESEEIKESDEIKEGLKHLKIELNNLKLAKEAFEKNKNSTAKESDEIKEDLKYLHNLIKEGKCSHIKSNLKEVPDNLTKNSELEIPVAENETMGIESLTAPAVTNNDNIKQQSIAPHSVTKTIHNIDGNAESHQLLNNIEIDNTLTKVKSDNIPISNLPATGSLKESDNVCDNINTKVKIENKDIKRTEWDNLIDRIFTPIELFIKELFNLINIIIGNGMGWCILIIILFSCSAAKAANPEANIALRSSGHLGLKNQILPGNPSISNNEEYPIIFEASVFSKTYIMNLGMAEDKLIEAINESQHEIAIQNQICINKPIFCPITQHIKKSQENSINKHSQILSYLGTACETKSRSNKSNTQPAESGPITFGTIMGTSAGLNLAAIAQAASINKELQKETKITEDKSIEYSDNTMEHFSSGIESIISQNQKEITSSNIKSVTKMAKATATAVSTLISRRDSTAHCENRSLKTTLYVTVINPWTRTSLTKQEGRLYESSSNKQRYILLSEDSILSKPSTVFNQKTLLVGRTCWADKSINASTSSTSDPLIQTITISSKGNSSIIESCLHKDQWITKTWTISPLTKLELPITCSLASETLNCSAMPIRSSVTQKNILPNLRMKIIEQRWSEKDCSLADTQPKWSICTGGIIIIIWVLAKIGIKLAREGIKLASYRAYGDIRINVPISPLSPVPSAPYNDDTMSETMSLDMAVEEEVGIIQDVIKQNNEIQLQLEKNKAQIEALLLHYSCTTVPEQETN